MSMLILSIILITVVVIITMWFRKSASNRKIGYMVETNLDPKSGQFHEIEYSPYYEFEQFNSETGLITRLVITLGPERVPEGFRHQGPFSDDLPSLYRDGIIDWVYEIYFINTSKQPIVIDEQELVVGDYQKLFSGATTIQPGKLFITEPLVRLNSNYGTEMGFILEFTSNKLRVEIEGIAKRMTTIEVKNKYQ
ncbi:MAG: hypothetical protein GY787_14910 [Alteromonadales bacterium]|nr:hypothetical protein [Alteromonadales bacterium]